LRQRLGREPTADEIEARRKALIKLRYADVAVTDLMFRDEIENLKTRGEI
jgi:hypothetical protein